MFSFCKPSKQQLIICSIFVMKPTVPSALTLPCSIFCVLLWANVVRGALTFSYWDPEGFRGTLNTYTVNTLSGTWENNSWSRNSDGSAGSTADTGQPAPQA